MTLYEKNIKCITQSCPYVDLTNPRSGSFSLCVEKSAKGLLTAASVTDESNGKKVYLHSKYNPMKEAVDFIDGVMGVSHDVSEQTYDCTVLIFGVGFGYHLTVLLSRLSERGRVIIVEPDISFFLELIKYADLTNILSDERIYFMLGKNADEIRLMLNDYLDLIKAYGTVEGVLPAYKVLFATSSKKYDSALAAVNQNIGIIEFMSQKRGILSIQNFAEIVPELRTCLDYRNFIGKFINVPCVIVMAGPSLDKNIGELKSLYSGEARAFIICVYTALRPLLSHGITPDIVISTDSRQLIRESVNVKQERYNIPLLYVPTSPKELLQQFTGVRILCLTPADDFMLDSLRKLNKLKPEASDNYIRAGGSVACSALDFAVRCGCNPIIFTGLDLAFAPGDKTHTSGTNYDYTDKSFISRLKMIPTPGVYGDTVMAPDNMTVYRKWIEKYIELDKTGRIYIDATEGGALIEGTRIESLRAVRQKYIGNSFSLTYLEQLLRSGYLFSDDEYELFLSDILNILDEYESSAAELRVRITKLIELRDSGDLTACHRLLSDTDYFIDNMNSKLKLFSLLVNYAYISADIEYANKSTKLYMYSFEFRVSFYELLIDLIPSNILTFKAFLPINNQKN